MSRMSPKTQAPGPASDMGGPFGGSYYHMFSILWRLGARSSSSFLRTVTPDVYGKSFT